MIALLNPSRRKKRQGIARQDRSIDAVDGKIVQPSGATSWHKIDSVIENTLLVICLALGTVGISTSSRAESLPKQWATIQSTSLKVFVTSEKPEVSMKILAASDTKKPLYELTCNKGDTVDANGVEYYRMFQCYLFPITGEPSDLLWGAESWAVKAYETRGVFTYEQLIGPCKSDLNYGQHRVFYMRGMRLELSISNFKSPLIADMISGRASPKFSFDLDIKVQPNTNAVSEITAPPAENYCGGYDKLNANGEAVYHRF